jgi:hypothetical protein
MEPWRITLEPWRLTMEAWRFTIEPWRVSRPMVADSHHFVEVRDLYQVKSQIRICNKLKRRIRIHNIV